MAASSGSRRRPYTFLFTDIESSTQLLEANGEAYSHALGEHRRILRRVCAGNGGDEAGTAGDAYFAVFDRPEDAVKAATEAQLALRAHPWPAGCELRVRMGVHTGEAEHDGGEYVGIDVHAAARVCSAAHGGQILVSERTASEVDAPERFLDLGDQRLRGVSGTTRVHQLLHPQLPREFPSIRGGEHGGSSSSSSIRVLLVDDQELVRTGFRMVLGAAQGLTVVGEAEDGLAALDAAERLLPDVVLMDIRMPEMNGIDAARHLTSLPTPPRVIMLTTFDLDEYVYDALRAGASGFLLKDAPPAELIRAIKVVAKGESLLAPSVTRRLIEEFANRPSSREAGAKPSRLEGLSAREVEVLVEIARGRVNGEIAAALFISETTVKSHVRNLLMKLDARDRVQLVVAAYEAGLVRPHDAP
jgi:DNA-binding NarL/FixJ family response regulator/class 3 adenylate cyclase